MLGPPPLDDGSGSLRDVPQKQQILVEPLPHRAVIQIEDRNQHAMLGDRHVDGRARGDRRQGVGGRHGPWIVPCIMKHDGLAPDEILDVRAVIEEAQGTGEAANSRRVPVPNDGDRFRYGVDGSVARPVHSQCVTEKFANGVREVTLVFQVPQAIVQLDHESLAALTNAQCFLREVNFSDVVPFDEDPGDVPGLVRYRLIDEIEAALYRHSARNPQPNRHLVRDVSLPRGVDPVEELEKARPTHSGNASRIDFRAAPDSPPAGYRRG